jgi:hypothetical protein
MTNLGPVMKTPIPLRKACLIKEMTGVLTAFREFVSLIDLRIF